MQDFGPYVQEIREGLAKPSVRPGDFSDSGNAMIFIRTYKDDLIFTDALGWLYWDGMRWVRDDHTARQWGVDLADQMLEEAQASYREALLEVAEAQTKYTATQDEQDKNNLEKAKTHAAVEKTYLLHAKKTRNNISINNFLAIAKDFMVVKADLLDADPFMLNTPGGIVDLRNGNIVPHDRKAYCTQITKCAPDNKGREMWDEFVKTVANGDSDIEWYLQMVIGSALIGKVFHEGLIMAYGGGRNCKSTFFNANLSALGDYAGTIDVKVLTTDRQNRGASLATLRGKRLVVAGELEEHQRLSVSTLKQICSTDRITIEEKFRQPETVVPSHTLVMFTNFLPRVGSTDGGTWRRLNVVPFKAQIPPGGGIQNFADVLVEQAGGAILHWAIEGAIGFAGNGYHLQIPDSVAAATEEYKNRENWIGNFIEARCVVDPNARTPAAVMYHEYSEWARNTGDYVRPERNFKETMEQQGYQYRKMKNGRFWQGLNLVSAENIGKTW